jgi:putative phosphoribosyl transferase
MNFRNRVEAGEKLTQALLRYRDRHETVVIGLPRGGVVVAYQVAHALHLPLDVICPRKIGAPSNPELAIGAITEEGDPTIDLSLAQSLAVSEEYLHGAIEREREVARQRLKLYRGDRPPLELRGQTVILVDDGLATGATMKAAIVSAKSRRAHRIVVAVPISPPDTAEEIKQMVDTFICLDTPSPFFAVGQWYEEFGQTSDAEVIELLKKSS